MDPDPPPGYERVPYTLTATATAPGVVAIDASVSVVTGPWRTPRRTRPEKQPGHVNALRQRFGADERRL
jgi:hypothetical protein